MKCKSVVQLNRTFFSIALCLITISLGIVRVNVVHYPIHTHWLEMFWYRRDLVKYLFFGVYFVTALFLYECVMERIERKQIRLWIMVASPLIITGGVIAYNNLLHYLEFNRCELVWPYWNLIRDDVLFGGYGLGPWRYLLPLITATGFCLVVYKKESIRSTIKKIRKDRLISQIEVGKKAGPIILLRASSLAEETLQDIVKRVGSYWSIDCAENRKIMNRLYAGNCSEIGLLTSRTGGIVFRSVEVEVLDSSRKFHFAALLDFLSKFCQVTLLIDNMGIAESGGIDLKECEKFLKRAVDHKIKCL